MFPIGNMRLEDAKALGHAVRVARRALGVTQEQLALTAGTHRRFVVELEAGKPTAQVGKVLNVLRTLGVVVEVILPPGISEARPLGPRTRRVKRGKAT
jgi:y4mF family transcriptional regulator